MALTIPDLLQTKTYTAKSVRDMFMDDFGVEGVGNALANDMNVTQRGAGATMSVDIAAGAAWIKGDTSSRQGLYHIYNDAVVNVAIANNSSGNPRIDQIICRVYDSVDGGAAQDIGAFEVVQGTPTAGAQAADPTAANYRSGAAALPATAVRLADVLVANGAASIVNANITDRRPRAFGQRMQAVPTTSGPTSTATTAAVIPQMQITMECNGRPIMANFSASLAHGTANGWVTTTLYMDGNLLASYPAQDGTANTMQVIDWAFLTTPAAGLHTFDVRWATLAGTMTASGLSRVFSLVEL